MKNIQQLNNLLAQISLIVKKNNEILDATGGRFNVFNIIGLASDEVRLHSALIAELLNPKGPHGLGDEFLKTFISQIQYDDFECSTAKIKVEMSVGNLSDTEGGRIDIVISDNNGNAIIIENKIYANDQRAQLIRYDNHGNKYYNGKYKILYLTLDGREATKESAGNVKYIPISYEKHILTWLENCVMIAVRNPLVRETINQYITLIKQLTNQDMNTINKDEVVNTILSTSENLDAAFSIIENLSAIKEKIITQYLDVQLEEIAKELQIEATKLCGRTIYSYFKFMVPDWKYFRIGFDFEKNNFGDLIYYVEILNKEQYVPEKTIEILSPFFQKHNTNKNIPCGYSNFTKYPNWNNSAFKAIVCGEMKSEIKSIVANILERCKGLDM